eukprot:gb/GFBE01068146.1/.p1 GENE.gb/GFBE01068146.1/~~gb/GFBE01068146.1/.p1  ORF type:complete len:399 (+),score=97.89 gb/GFBE01068146.1/:1-1197(+)
MSLLPCMGAMPHMLRVDPADGFAYTFEELESFYRGTYSDEEVQKYWKDACRPVIPAVDVPREPQLLTGAKAPDDSHALISVVENVQEAEATKQQVTKVATPPRARRGREPAFHAAQETIIIFDWDDTLFPTTSTKPLLQMYSNMEMAMNGVFDWLPPKSKADLSELGKEVKHLVDLAHVLADKVVIITNAQDGWVEQSACALPSFFTAVASCEVRSARSGYEACGGSAGDWKTRCFEDVVQEFYGERRRSNVISIGDSSYELEAVGRLGASRCKSLKLQASPSVKQLTTEIRMIQSRLRKIVSHDGHLSLTYKRGELRQTARNTRGLAYSDFAYGNYYSDMAYATGGFGLLGLQPAVSDFFKLYLTPEYHDYSSATTAADAEEDREPLPEQSNLCTSQ